MILIKSKNMQNTIYWGMKIALSLAFISAVADRFGMWGNPGAAGVAWGSFDNFLTYTAALNPWAPKAIIPIIGWGVTILGLLLAILLVTKLKTTEVAFTSGALLLLFATSMTITAGLKGALDYSVFTASFAAFGLSSLSHLRRAE